MSADLQPKLTACFAQLSEPRTFGAAPTGDMFDVNMGSVDATFGSILDTVRDWLKIADIMPSKADVLAWVSAAFDASRLSGRVILKKVLLAAVSMLYDSIATL